MTNKELRKMSRSDLLKVLLEQSKEIEELRNKLDAAETQLKTRKLELKDAGSIADAALKVNHVFEVVQEAADQYLENIEQINNQQTEICRKLIADAEYRCKEMEKQTKNRCAQMMSKAKKESQEYWDETNKKLEEFVCRHEELREILSMTLPRE